MDSFTEQTLSSIYYVLITDNKRKPRIYSLGFQNFLKAYLTRREKIHNRINNVQFTLKFFTLRKQCK